MRVKCLQICAHVFIARPQNCAQTSFRSCAGLRPNFGHSRSKLCPIMCCSRTKLCPNFGCSCARLCPISFAPCPFPNLAGTLVNKFDVRCSPVYEGQKFSPLRPQYKGIIDAVKLIKQQEGVRGLYKGITPNVWGAGSSWGLYFLL